MRRLLIGMAVLALATAACGGGDTATEDEAQQQEQQEQQEEGAASLSVQAQEYEFVGVPDTVAAGEVTFEVENVGEEPHEMQLARIISDRPVEEIIEIGGQELMEHIEPVGGTFVEPGQSAEFGATLEPGRYGYVCFVEAPDGEPHAQKGMFGEFTVE